MEPGRYIVGNAGILVTQPLAAGGSSGVPLLTIVMRHQANDGSSVATGVQLQLGDAGNAAIPTLSDAAPALTKEAGTPESGS